MTKTSKTILWIIIAIVIVGGIWYGVSRKPAEEGVIKIGVLADLTGDYASLIKGIPKGAELAVEDLRKEGVRIDLIIEDQKSCNAAETVTIMHKFVDIDKVDLIIGGSCSNTTLAAAPIANSAKTIMISPMSSAPSVSQAGEYIFRTYISDILRAKEAAQLVYRLGKRKMAIITEVSNQATVEISSGVREEFIRLSGQIVGEEKATKTDVDFRTVLTKIKSTNPDVLLISCGPNQIGFVAKQAKELNFNVQFIVPLETAEDPQVIEIGKDAVEGLIYIMPGNPPETAKYKEFMEKYSAKYGEKELLPYLTESYDAVMLGVRAILASNGTKEDIKNKLYEVSKKYEGVSGNVTFDENGDVTKPVFLKTIKNGQFILY